MGEEIVDFWDGRVIQSHQYVGFTFEILNDCLPYQGVWCLVDHFFYSHQLQDIGKMQIPRTVNRSHPTYANHILDLVAVHQHDASTQLIQMSSVSTGQRINTTGFQNTLQLQKECSLLHDYSHPQLLSQ